MFVPCPNEHVREREHPAHPRRGVCDGDGAIGQNERGDVARVLDGHPLRLADAENFTRVRGQPGNDTREKVEQRRPLKLPRHDVAKEAVA